ncbi:tyrosine-type recombinase/integrase, partial [Porphyromonas circumdentaria]
AVPLSAHVGRHTFATLITLERGVPIETVSRMLGHGSIKTTERYAHVTPKKLFDEFERFLSFTEDLRLSL